MADTKRTLSALQTLLANNTGGNIGAQDIRDFLISCVLTDSGSGSDQIQIKPHTGDSTTFFQILDFDGGTPILNVDSVNERVGIGTDAPDAALEVVGNLHLDGASSVVLRIDKNNAASHAYMTFETAGSQDWWIGTPYNGGAFNGEDFIIGTNFNAAYLVIDKTNGDVVIGHTSATGLFNTVKSAANNNTYLETYSATDSHGSLLILAKSASNTKGTLTETVDGEFLGAIKFYGVDNAQTFDVGAHIYAIQNGTPGDKIPSNLILETYTTTINNANQLVLHSDGNIGIGTDEPLAALDINDDSMRIRTSQSPASGGAGVQGEMAWDGTYFYCCVSTNTWGRIAWTLGY